MGVSYEMEKGTPQMAMADQELEKVAPQGGQRGMAMSLQTKAKLRAVGLISRDKPTGLPGWLQWCLGL